ncbi:Coenzyme F420 hydrogenase/dehydrogenase, beta subunit C-terminal domain [Jannaschia sp. LMIT008]|uniref:Coenzyme F420 hydrogenase/dehydrogenase, beta subunit C-terminal domain n=1 Tax=Jannaschia maritima TaxID=3032585 RepID=UPI002810D068|nr:Coenzyme F420 hydrogenase/dehydrogenase, beta subunit C-terminal domain [Jannaschia sp. LMIT008]
MTSPPTSDHPRRAETPGAHDTVIGPSQIDRVVAGGFCIGCGACTLGRNAAFDVGMTREGHYVAARIRPDGPGDEAVCPMSDLGRDETAIGASLYPDLPFDPEIGRHRATLAGHVAEGRYRAEGAAGGLVTWLAQTLLERGMVDAVAHIHAVPGDGAGGPLFQFALSRDVDTLRAGAKSRYYPVTMAEVLPLIAGGTDRFLVIGVPCFIKAIRQLQDAGRISHEQVPFTIGLVCGHLKSRFFAEYLAWQGGTGADRLHAVNFRHKLEGRQASSYGFAHRRRDAPDDEVVRPMSTLAGRDWGEGQFKNPACECCDDVVGECADISVGDAWLSPYVGDWRGSNVVVTRNAEIDAIVAEGRRDGALEMDDVTPEQVALSQSSGLRHRREGLAHRLARLDTKGHWHPRKRVAPRLADERSRRLIYDMRYWIARNSSRVAADILGRGGTFEAYRRRMRPVMLALKIATSGKRIALQRMRRLTRR